MQSCAQKLQAGLAKAMLELSETKAVPAVRPSSVA